jgi:DNA-directed RNA polymerase subunit RPC12/RpoP
MQDIFICSFCEQQLRLKPEQITKSVRCPKCSNLVWLLPNATNAISSQLVSEWFYMKDRLLRKPEETGPVMDEEFLQLLTTGSIAPETQVKSPSMTNGQWVTASRINTSMIKAQVSQRAAEVARLHRVAQRQAQADSSNREKLFRAIQQAVSDGRISVNEREQIYGFAKAIGVTEDEVANVLKSESERLFQRVLEESLADGWLDPSERERLSALSSSLGLRINLNASQSEQLQLAEQAWLISNGRFSIQDCSTKAQLNKGEELLASTTAEWLEVSTAKTFVGIPLGNGRHLKSVVEGECILTNKRIAIMGSLDSKKMTFASVAYFEWFSDGLFCNRSTGASVFLRPLKGAKNWSQFVLLAQHVRSGDPVVGLIPKNSFVPKTLDEDVLTTSGIDSFDRSSRGAKYTFRVVGDFVSDRQARGSQMQIGDTILLRREPDNPYDPNAVSVRDSLGGDLGYLKREVAEWFAGILDSKKPMRFSVAGWTTGGSLLVDVFEL